MSELSVEALEALPVGAVVIDGDGTAHQKQDELYALKGRPWGGYEAAPNSSEYLVSEYGPVRRMFTVDEIVEEVRRTFGIDLRVLATEHVIETVAWGDVVRADVVKEVRRDGRA